MNKQRSSKDVSSEQSLSSKSSRLSRQYQGSIGSVKAHRSCDNKQDK